MTLGHPARAYGKPILFCLALTIIAACGARDENVAASTGALEGSDGGNSNAVPQSTPGPLSPTSSIAPGTFQQVTPAKTGSVVAVGDSIPWLVDSTNNTLYHYSESEPPAFAARNWVQIAGTANTRFVTASPEGTPWRIDTSGNVFKGTCNNNTCTWAQSTGITAWEVAFGRNNTGWAISNSGPCNSQTSNSDCPVYHYLNGSWSKINGTTARHITTDATGTAAWITTAAGTVFKWVNGFTAWGVGTCANNPSTGTFRDKLGIPVIGAGPLDAVWMVGCTAAGNGNQIRAWNPITLLWEIVPGSAISLSVGADGTPWVLDSQASIFQYQTAWQFVGPSGFTFLDNSVQARYTGEVQDVSVAATGDVVIGAGAGGVWHAFSTSPSQWTPIADRSPQTPGPTFAVSTIAVAPGNPNQIFVGTGVPFWNNSTTTQSGNGIWFTNNLGASWQAATCDGVSCTAGVLGSPQIVRIRYNGGAVINVATPTRVLSGSNNGVFSTVFTPPSGSVITDIVGDPNDTSSVFIGFSGTGSTGGVCKRNLQTGSQQCTTGVLAGQGFVRLAVASAVTPTLLFAATWDNAFHLSGVFSTQTFPTFSANLFNISNAQFDDGAGRMTGLAVNPQGTTVLLASHSVARGSNGGTSWEWIDNPATHFANHTNLHDDYHAVAYDASGTAYAVSDGGYFTSADDGVTWSNANNTFGVANEMSVDVSPSGIYAGAWDTGGHFKTNGFWQGDSLLTGDSNQMVANPNTPDAYYVHAVGTARYAFHNGVWANVDYAPVQAAGISQMAVNSNTDVFTISLNGVFRSSNWGGAWTQFDALFASGTDPLFLNVTSEAGTNVYVSGFGDSSVFFGGASWTAAAIPPAWTPGNGVCATAIPRLYYTSGQTDYYILGTSQASIPCQQATSVPTSGRQNGALYRTSNQGSTWTQLSGTGSLGINQSEVPNAIAIDTSSNSVALATEGLGSSCPAPGAPCGAGIYKLNNPAVDNPNIHWRRWINGLPNPAQLVHGLSGQYETNANGVPIFFYYAAVYGRGIWSREARGGEP